MVLCIHHLVSRFLSIKDQAPVPCSSVSCIRKCCAHITHLPTLLCIFHLHSHCLHLPYPQLFPFTTFTVISQHIIIRSIYGIEYTALSKHVAYSQKAPVSLVIFVCSSIWLSACISLTPCGEIFKEIWYWRFSLKFIKKIQIWFKLDKSSE